MVVQQRIPKYVSTRKAKKIKFETNEELLKVPFVERYASDEDFIKLKIVACESGTRHLLVVHSYKKLSGLEKIVDSLAGTKTERQIEDWVVGFIYDLDPNFEIIEKL